MAKIRAYLDTCIISGIAKGDASQEDLGALEKILAKDKENVFELVTSSVVKQEIAAIPEAYREPHLKIFHLFSEVPLVKSVQNIPPFKPLPMFRREDRLLVKLKKLLPDQNDAVHAFQAIENRSSYLITIDKRTFLKYAVEVKSLCALELIGPKAFIAMIESIPRTSSLRTPPLLCQSVQTKKLNRNPINRDRSQYEHG